MIQFVYIVKASYSSYLIPNGNCSSRRFSDGSYSGFLFCFCCFFALLLENKYALARRGVARDKLVFGVLKHYHVSFPILNRYFQFGFWDQTTDKHAPCSLKVQRLKQILFTTKISLSKRIKQLNQCSVPKELRRSDFFITIEEYIGARETPLSTTKM